MKITEVSLQKNNNLKVNVFVDGKFTFSLDAADAALRGIKEGKKLTEKDIQNLIMDSEFTKARDYALGILSRKPITGKMLSDKIKEKGYNPIVIPEVINELTDLGYIDDEAYAVMYMEYCAEKMWGKRKITFEMKNKGIPLDIINSILDSYDDSNETYAMAELILTKYKNEDITDIKVKSKITRYFVSRGFDFAKTDTAIQLALKELENE